VKGLLQILPGVLLAVLLLAVASGVGSARAQSAVGKTVEPGKLIQKAINAAHPGDTIVVQGVHREDVVIRKNGISLRGLDAVIEPPAKVGSPGGLSGICVLGDVNSNTNKVNKYVNDASISGFTVRGFKGIGIVSFGARNANFTNNTTIDNEEYGLTAFASTGTKMIANVARGADEAGIYVGDSPNAKVVGNNTYRNSLGIFVRNALGGTIAGNQVHNNCLGVLVLADAPGPAGNFGVQGNEVRDNTRSCPATEEAPPLSGVGISLFGARGVEVTGNNIAGNIPTGPTIFSGGVIMKCGLGGTAPRDNSVVANNFGRNKPDIFWDGSGPNNRFATNNCNTSVPARLCR
jgi:parallel beta-helix repeat protein